jgi:hypothetical protein
MAQVQMGPAARYAADFQAFAREVLGLDPEVTIKVALFSDRPFIRQEPPVRREEDR